MFPPEDLLEAALDDAARLASGATKAMAAVKRAVAGGWDAPIERGLEIEAAEFAETFATEDARIGVAAFLAKEEAEFTGR